MLNNVPTFEHKMREKMTDTILIIYYSRTGNTEHIAKLIHKEVGGTLHRIRPETPYPNAYNATVEQAKQEIKSGIKPPLRNALDNVREFDLVFIGSPNWWSTIAPPVRTFLAAHDFSDKTLAPFCTHGGGGLGRISSNIAELCPLSSLLKPFKTYGSGGAGIEAEVATWLFEIKSSL